MNRYYHVGVFLGTGVIPNERILRIQNVLTQHSNDWLRYAPNCWVVYSPVQYAHVIAQSIQATLQGKTPQGEEEQVLVFEINFGNYYGWVSEMVRDWLSKPRY